MKDLISIVIPAYNIGNCLAHCLDSVAAQTYPHLEILVVNDGSTDHTAAVLDAFAARDSRVRAIHKENGGVTSARLRGIREATGEWIGFVDGDDEIEPQMFERLLQNAEAYEADISHCGYQMVFPNGRVDWYYNTGRVVQQDRITGLKDLIEGTFVEPGLWNKLYRKELFGELLSGVMDPSIKINEDLLMNYYLFKHADRAVLEDVCPYHYILRKGSAATSKLNEHKLKDPLRVLDILCEEAKTIPEVLAAVKMRRVYQWIQLATMPWGTQRTLVAPYRREVRKKLRRELNDILSGGYCSRKIQAMACWAAVWPWSYGAVHRLYEKVTGLDKKYDVE